MRRASVSQAIAPGNDRRAELSPGRGLGLPPGGQEPAGTPGKRLSLVDRLPAGAGRPSNAGPRPTRRWAPCIRPPPPASATSPTCAPTPTSTRSGRARLPDLLDGPGLPVGPLRAMRRPPLPRCWFRGRMASRRPTAGPAGTKVKPPKNVSRRVSGGLAALVEHLS